MATGYTGPMQPSQLGPYTIGARLGRGGMGAVYEATDGVGERVAVKVLASHLADDAGLRKRFDAEIETLKSLRHPGIVRLLAFGEEDDQPYFAMELVPGQSLEQLLRGGRRFTWEETVSVALAVTRALKVAHDHGVVHRDLKPANLLVADGDAAADLGSRVKLADFGIAKLFGGAAHTAHGNVVGTAEYMAPEQAAGRPADHRVDLYALGLVMFAMLSGRPPFTGSQAIEVLRRQQHEPAPRISTLVPGVPPELDELIDRMLAKDPTARPANALALGRLLTAIATVNTPAPPTLGPTTDLPMPTRPDGARRDVDLYAPTRGATGSPAGPQPKHAGGVPQTRAATGAKPDNTTKLADAGASTGTGTGANPAATTVVERTPRSRFTTVAELERQADKRRARDRSLEHLWQAIAVVGTLTLLGATGYLLFRKPTVEEVYGRIEAARAAAEKGGDLRDASPAIDDFLTRFPDDPRAGEVRKLDRALALDQLEKRARRRPLGSKPLLPVERDYRAAMDREADSPSACRDALEALIAVHQASAPAKPASTPEPARLQDDPTLWLDLARRQVERLGPAADKERKEDARRIAEIFSKADALAAEAARAVGGHQETLLGRRRALLQSVIDLYGQRPHAATAVATARKMLTP